MAKWVLPENKEEFTEVQTAFDMKAVIILTCCDIIENLDKLGDHNGATALKILVETIQNIPTKPC